MAEVTNRADERERLEGDFESQFAQLVIRPHGFAVPADPEAIKRENALMEQLHEDAVTAARREKLKLLSLRYSLGEDDFEGLALALAIQHEPGFRVNRQITDPANATDVTADDKEGTGFWSWCGLKMASK